MGALKDAISAIATANQRAAMAAEDWCKANGWTRICDIPSDLYQRRVLLRWTDLTAAQRSSWVSRYANTDEAERAWEEWGRIGEYRVSTGFVMDDGTFLYPYQWRQLDLNGRGFMQVFDLQSEAAP